MTPAEMMDCRRCAARKDAERDRLAGIIGEIRSHAMRWALSNPQPGDPAMEILRLVNDGTAGPTIGEGKR